MCRLFCKLLLKPARLRSVDTLFSSSQQPQAILLPQPPKQHTLRNLNNCSDLLVSSLPAEPSHWAYSSLPSLFLLICFGFHIMQSLPTYLPISSNLPSALASQNQITNKTETETSKHLVEAAEWPLSHTVHPLVRSSLLARVQCHSHWSGSSPLASATPSIISINT